MIINVKDKRIEKEKIDDIVTECLMGLPKMARTFTVRKEYVLSDDKKTGSWEPCDPYDGEGIAKIKERLIEMGLRIKEDFDVYSLEEEDDFILHIVFYDYIQKIYLEVDFHEML